ncbi:hypothetical protein Tco_1022071, partial [Tanacetum coccineum]
MQISNSVFVTNFLEHFMSRDFWKVINLERLIENLSTIWIGRLHLHANVVRFQRDPKPSAWKPKGTYQGTHVGVNIANSRDSYVSILKKGNPSYASSEDSCPALVLDDAEIHNLPSGFTSVENDAEKGDAQYADNFYEPLSTNSGNKNDSGSSKGAMPQRSANLFSKEISMDVRSVHEKVSFEFSRGTVLLKTVFQVLDYGATLFRVFHSWFNMEGFDKVVENSLKKSNFVKSNSMSIQKKLSDVDKVLDQSGYSEDTMNYCSSLLKELHDISSIKASDIAQKAKAEDLKHPISYDEIKRAVWDCGTNKSLGPDGFTFEFFHRYWNLIDHDVVNVVSYFFASGEWNTSNINTIEVDRTTRIVGCSTFSSPFHYHGVKVGGVMSKISSWDEVNSKMYSRLSKWKLNSLSIGGRLTLLKSVISSILLYHIWKKVLTSKQKGGLSLSILFAINRALMFKWLWCFKTQSPSLWSRVIKAIYGVHGGLDTFFCISRSSPWLDILHGVSSLKFKGIDLCALIRKK